MVEPPPLTGTRLQGQAAAHKRVKILGGRTRVSQVCADHPSGDRQWSAHPRHAPARRQPLNHTAYRGSGANRARTGDLRAASATLSQLSYSPVAPQYTGALAYGMRREDGRAAIPRGSARHSSTIAVSATATPDRCSSRPSKSATIASSERR